MRVLFNLATVTFEAARIQEALTGRRRAPGARETAASSGRTTRQSCGICTSRALYLAGDWDASLAEADLLARVPDMAAHVRAAGLLVLVGRGDPAARERIGWARASSRRLSAHVLLAS